MNRPIRENLKRLRVDRGLTQEQLAQRVHLTRQAISGYEAGRTQPDLETLKRLAQALDADIMILLYGSGRDALRTWRKWTALTTIILVLTLLCAGSALLWAANSFFWLEEGLLSPEARSILDSRRSLTGLNEALTGLALWLTPLGGIAVLFLTLPAKPPVPPQRQIKWAALLGMGAFAVTLPWNLMDPHLTGYSPNYMAYPELICLEAAILLAVNLPVTFLRRRKAR